MVKVHVLSLVQTPIVFSMGSTPEGFFTIQHGSQELLSITSPSSSSDETDLPVLKTVSLSATAISADQISLLGAIQWSMFKLETFPSAPIGAFPAGALVSGQCSDCLNRGWSSKTTILCSGLSILSLQDNILSNTYTLPLHTSLRITGLVHFVDDWQGETAFLKIDGEYVWSDAVDQENTPGKMSVCGSDKFPEIRFSVPIDIVIPHSAAKVELLFSTTVETDAFDARFGISNIALHLRNGS